MNRRRPLVHVSEEIDLYPNDFRGDNELLAIAKVLSDHVALARARYRSNEAPVRRQQRTEGLPLIRSVFWSDSVPWYEWLMDLEVLEGCARACDLAPAELADVLAFRLRPSNHLAFLWMAEAMRSKDWAQGRDAFGARVAGEIDRDRRARQARAAQNGKKSAEVRAQASDVLRAKLQEHQERLLAQGKPKQSVAKMLADSHGISEQHVRRMLKESRT